MNILFVDDEMDILEGMLDAIDFEALGIKNVYISQSAEHAWQIVQSREIDILVTDIEMPGESGLALLEWIRKSEIAIVTLFCTAFANFDYAQKAVELHSFGYFLKPVAYDLLWERLLAACGEVKKNRSLTEYKKYGHYLQKSLRESKKTYWMHQMNHWEAPAEAKAESMGYHEDSCFTLGIFSLYDGEDTLGNWKRYAFINILEELLSQAGLGVEAQIPLDTGSWAYVFLQEGPLCQKDFFAACRHLQRYSQTYFFAQARVYYDKDVPREQVAGRYENVRAAFMDDVAGLCPLCLVRDYVLREYPYGLPQYPQWEILLAAGKSQQLCDQLDVYLDECVESKKINRPYLKALRMDIQQMVQTMLKTRQVSAHKLFTREEYEKLYQNSLRSIGDMKRYVAYLVGTACEHTNFLSQSQSLIGKVRAYIDSNLSEEISRQSLANQFFLNQDYLARLFKKETGQSLSTYLQQQRMHEAQKLLLQSPVSVKDIAGQVGFNNSSYFTQIFRENMGMTPNEFRKWNQGDG